MSTDLAAEAAAEAPKNGGSSSRSGSSSAASGERRGGRRRRGRGAGAVIEPVPTLSRLDRSGGRTPARAW